MKQKVNAVYGVIGLVALFLVGGIFGYIINGSNRINHSVMTKRDCIELSDQMMVAARNNRPEVLEQLNKVFSENCVDRHFEQPKPQPKPVEEKKLPNVTCEAVEDLLSEKLNWFDEKSTDAEQHIERAKIYAILSERGCENHSGAFKDLAKKELDIARALNDDNMENEREATEMVETYKRLKMQQEAEKMIEKAKKLTNPAIDFIIQLEKIIEE